MGSFPPGSKELSGPATVYLISPHHLPFFTRIIEKNIISHSYNLYNIMSYARRRSQNRNKRRYIKLYTLSSLQCCKCCFHMAYRRFAHAGIRLFYNHNLIVMYTAHKFKNVLCFSWVKKLKILIWLVQSIKHDNATHCLKCGKINLTK